MPPCRRWPSRRRSPRAWRSTIDSISNGRFGLNVITGWQRPEYAQMGLWPGDEYFADRYDYAAEYVQIMQRAVGRPASSNFKGEFFKMERLPPRARARRADRS